MIYLLVCILSTTAVMLLFKLTTSRGMPVPLVNFFYRAGMGIFAIIGLLSAFTLGEFPLLWAHTWMFVIPGVVLLYLSGRAVMSAMSHGHIGISNIVMKSSLALPVGYALMVVHATDRANFFRVLPWACAGCAAILLGFACFGAEGIGRTYATFPGKWIAWLSLGFFSGGGWDILVATTAGLAIRETQFCFYLTSLGAALTSSFRLKVSSGKQDWRLALCGIFAGLLALVVALTRPMAIKELGGLIVFPTASIGGILLMQLCASVFWKQHLGKIGWLGLAFAATGITLLVLSRQ